MGLRRGGGGCGATTQGRKPNNGSRTTLLRIEPQNGHGRIMAILLAGWESLL